MLLDGEADARLEVGRNKESRKPAIDSLPLHVLNDAAAFLLPLPLLRFAALGLRCRIPLASPCFLLGAILGTRLFGFLLAQTLALIRLGFRCAVQFGMGVFDFPQLQPNPLSGEPLLQLA